MQDGVRDSTYILIDWQPGLDLFKIEWLVVDIDTGEAKEVPRGVDEGIHSVGIAFGSRTAFRTVDIDPFIGGCKR